MQEYLKDRVKGRISLLRLLLEIVGVAGALVPCHRSELEAPDVGWQEMQRPQDALFEFSPGQMVLGATVTFNNNVGDVPETKPEGFDNCEPEVTNSVDDHRGRYWVVFQLTRQDTPPGPRRTRRLQVVSTPEAAECLREPLGGKAELKPRPMMETIRTDVVRGPFGLLAEGMEDVRYADPADMKTMDPEAPFKNAADATGKHGFVEEIMGFFVAPFDGHYSFLTWGDVRQDIWLSTSTDPADTIKVAERIDSQPCRTGDNRRRNRLFQATIAFEWLFYRIGYRHIYRLFPKNLHGLHEDFSVLVWGLRLVSVVEHGTHDFEDSYGFAGNPTLGFRTPTEVTVPLKQGERRFFVKRTSLAESYRKNFDIRRFRTYTGLRIHKPDLSSLTPMVLLKRIISKTGGQWRIGLREARDDEPTSSGMRT
ncbi:unnamed protein product [Symbiodinium microadriaticum]|nr:unnamed protein product [Symbiodinium microadriaticum]